MAGVWLLGVIALSNTNLGWPWLFGIVVSPVGYVLGSAFLATGLFNLARAKLYRDR
ncbi:MAG: hypothetical protein L0Z47_08185 [Actinobacteria bacterium]|nr:hypothetical protein [Actinomycetota bacterium]